MKRMTMVILLFFAVSSIFAQDKDSIALATKSLSTLESELKSLQSDKDKLNSVILKSKKDIADDQATIKANEVALAANKSTYETKNASYTTEKDAIAKFNPSGIADQMKLLEDEMKTIASNKDKANKEIALKMAAIEKLKADVVVLNQTVSTCETTYNAKKVEYDKLNNTVVSNTLDDRQKALKEMESELKKIQGDGDKIVKSTESNKTDIEKSNSAITASELSLKTTEANIIAKQTLVDQARATLNRLKSKSK